MKGEILIGVLALQGSFYEHLEKFKQLSVNSVEIRSAEDFESSKIDGIVIPGGESTVMSLLAQRTGLVGPLRK